MFCLSFSSKSKEINVFTKYSENEKTFQSKQARKILVWHVILNNYLHKVLCKFLIKVKSTWRRRRTDTAGDFTVMW